jgi:antirestriction protein ArdC
LDALKEIISGYKNCPKIVSERQDVACYYPEIDVINVPLVANIISPIEHALTTLHEGAHSTGHGTRLNRIGITGVIKKGSPEYAFEELIAELTAIFICVERGINAVRDNSAAYMKHWLQYLENDPKFLYNAAKEAQKAANYILGI